MPTNPTATFRNPGEFCWFDMLTPNVTASATFFANLLGWSLKETPMPGGSYTMALVGGKEIGGISDLDNPMTPKGTPPHIGCHVMVENAEATAKKVASAGGKVLAPPFDVMDFGRMAALQDPNGAMFNIWQPLKHRGTDCDMALAGAPSWFETMTTDVDRAAKFYRDVFGWEPEIVSMGKDKYVTFKHRNGKAGGMMQITKEMGPMPSSWGVYFTVGDSDKTAKECAKLGGKVTVPPTDIPNIGRFACLTSPQGVNFSVLKYTATK